MLKNKSHHVFINNGIIRLMYKFVRKCSTLIFFKCDLVRVCAEFSKPFFSAICYSVNIYFTEQKASSDNLCGIAAKPMLRIVFGLPYISVCQVPWNCISVMLSICFSQLLFIFIYFYVQLYCNGLNSDHSEAAETPLYFTKYDTICLFYAYLHSVTFAVCLPSHRLFVKSLSFISHCDFPTWPFLISCSGWPPPHISVNSLN